MVFIFEIISLVSPSSVHKQECTFEPIKPDIKMGPCDLLKDSDDPLKDILNTSDNTTCASDLSESDDFVSFNRSGLGGLGSELDGFGSELDGFGTSSPLPSPIPRSSSVATDNETYIPFQEKDYTVEENNFNSDINESTGNKVMKKHSGSGSDNQTTVHQPDPSNPSNLDPQIPSSSSKSSTIRSNTSPISKAENLKILQTALLGFAAIIFISILIYSIYYVILIRKIYSKERITE